MAPNRTKTVNRKCGAFRLPDEILLLIVDHVYRHHEQRPQTIAGILYHLGYPSVWTSAVKHFALPDMVVVVTGDKFYNAFKSMHQNMSRSDLTRQRVIVRTVGEHGVCYCWQYGPPYKTIFEGQLLHRNSLYAQYFPPFDLFEVRKLTPKGGIAVRIGAPSHEPIVRLTIPGLWGDIMSARGCLETL